MSKQEIAAAALQIGEQEGDRIADQSGQRRNRQTQQAGLPQHRHEDRVGEEAPVIGEAEVGDDLAVFHPEKTVGEETRQRRDDEDSGRP